MVPFVDMDTIEKLSKLKVLIAGCGSVGSNIAYICARQGILNLDLADPDFVEIKNLSRQYYNYEDVAKNKAEVLAINLNRILPKKEFNSKYVPYKDGIDSGNVRNLVENNDVIVDAIDILSIDMIYQLHKTAKELKKPVIVGYDLAGTALVHTFRYDKKDIPILNGAITEKEVALFKKVRDSFVAHEINQDQFIDFTYSLISLPINPLHVPIEQLDFLLNYNLSSHPQLGTTSNILANVIVEVIRKIVQNIEIKNEIHIDLPKLVKSKKENKAKKYYLMLKVLKLLKARRKLYLSKYK